MKTLAIWLIIIVTPLAVFSQKIYTNQNDVYEARRIMFYGYDFTGFQLSDPKRIGQDLKSYIFQCIGVQQDNLSEKKLAKWIDKDVVHFNFEPTLAVNKKITGDDIGAVIKYTLPPDSVQPFINKYKLTEKEGIGLVIIFDCFDNDRKTITGYYAFFDIATKKALLSYYIISRDGKSYNRLADWSAAAYIATKKMTDDYLEKKKTNW